MGVGMKRTSGGETESEAGRGWAGRKRKASEKGTDGEEEGEGEEEVKKGRKGESEGKAFGRERAFCSLIYLWRRNTLTLA